MNLRAIPAWGWALIVFVAVLVGFATFAVLATPTSWETDSILICDANGTNCEPLE